MRRGYFSRDSSVRSGAWNASLVVLATSGCVALLGGSIVSEMFQKTRSIGWETPPNSTSLAAEEEVQLYFPKRLQGSIVMAVEALPGTPSVISEAVAEFSRNVSQRVAKDWRVRSFKPIVLGYYLDSPGGQAMHKMIQEELVSHDKRMTLIFIQPTTLEGSISDANAFLQEFCDQPPSGFTLHITGMPSVMSGDGCFAGVHGKVNTRDMNFELIFRAELMTVPVALVIIGRMVKYVRLLLLPLILVIISFIVCAAMLVPWMDVVPIAHDVPAAMGSVIMALCLDYSLFFLSRFGEQHSSGWQLQANVDTVLRETGHTIMISGSLIAIAFFGSMVLPEDNLKGSGLCMGIAVVACVATSLALIPALLLFGGRTLTGTVVRNPWNGDMEMDGSSKRQELELAADPSKEPHVERSHWLRMMRWIDKSPLVALGVVLLLLSPVLLCVPALNVTGDRFALIPMGMPALQALRRIEQVFPVGVLDPYAVVISAPPSASPALFLSELQDGMAALQNYDSEALSAHMTLSPSELALVTSTLADARDSKGRLRPSVVARATLASHARCDELAAVGAGAASAVAEHATAAASLRAALQAAHATGCGESAVRRAVVASAVDARGRSDGEESKQMASAVQLEATELGWSEASAKRLGDEVANASRSGKSSDASEESLVDVRAGADAVRARATRAGGGRGAVEHPQHAAQSDGITAADVVEVMRAAAAHQEVEAVRQALVAHAGAADVSRRLVGGGAEVMADAEAAPEGLNRDAAAAVTAALASVTQRQGAGVSGASSQELEQRWPLVLDVVDAAADLSEHGALLMPSGFAAMLDLCDRTLELGRVASMVGPTWAYHKRIDWITAVALHANATLRKAYQPLLDSHVEGTRALLEVHTTFPSIGAGGANWVLDMRRVLAEWEAAHPGFTARLSGGNCQAADTRSAVLSSMWRYLGIIVALIMVVVFFTFRSVLVPLRLALALFVTLGATYGAGVIIYQTPLLHGLFPWLAPFDGLTYEVVPMVTGICIALGLDYDIFLVSRVVEFRKQGFSDRASVFRGATKAGGVISGAGLIMSLAFSGLCFSDKLLMQQFGVLLVISVMFDTFVVRTVLVPALMLIAQDWNWWPRQMPPVLFDSLEGDVGPSDDDNGYRPMLNGG